MNGNFTDKFLQHLKQRGLSIEGPREGDDDDKLYLHGPAEERTPEIMNALKAFKPRLIELYGRKKENDDRGEM